MTDHPLFHVKPGIAADAHVNAERYRLMANHAALEPNEFWTGELDRVVWSRRPNVIKNTDFTGDVSIKWFEDGRLNASVSCLDRHLATRGDQVAILWEGDAPDQDRRLSYRALYEQVCRLANVLKR